MATKALAKVCLLGEGMVGKTSLRRRFMGQGFSRSYLMTLGAEMSVKTVTIEYEGRTVEAKLTIWDLAGQPGFKAVRKMYYERAKGGFLVFDVTRPPTLDSLHEWAEELFKYSGEGIVPIVVIGNKIDLREKNDKNHLTEEHAKKLVDELNEKYPEARATYYETSAKTGENVEAAFQELATRIVQAEVEKLKAKLSAQT